MVNSKKLLSLFLAVVMVLSTFAVMASAAYTRVETEGTVDIDVKYTVEKVDFVPETDAGSAEWYADNIYAVTVWMKSAKPVDTLIVPFHYNKTLFSPIMLSDGDCTYPYGAGLDQDTYYTDMGEGALYAYSLGDYMNNTGMYKANGTTATTKALAKCIGLGNANSDGVSITSELVSPDHPLYSKWGAGLPTGTGVMYAKVDCALKTKTAYLNTISGITTSTDWNRMLTVYFESIADDVVGAEFGVFTDDCFTLDGSYDGQGLGYFQGATKYTSLVPSMNVVSNAVVEAPATSIVNPMKGQIRFDKNADNTYAGTFDIRAIAKITGEDFDATFGSIADAEANITSVGFVFAQGEGNYDDMKAVAQAGASGNGYTYAPVDFISTSFDPGNYTFSCIVNNVNDKDDTLVALAYIEYVDANGDAQWAFYTDVQTVPFAELYDTYYGDVFGA